MSSDRHSTWGAWNNEIKVDAHPEAENCLRRLAFAAADFLRNGCKDSPERFARWLARYRKK